MLQGEKIQITKYSGETVAFSEEKLRKSLSNVGASEDTVKGVVEEVMESLYEGISTKEIYKRAHGLLQKKEYHKASRYHLKQGVLELGPTGYPFELLMGELFKAKGYTTEVGFMISGKCVSHEVDVLAVNDHEVLMLECKFHNQNGYKTDVKVPLYIQSRFKDLESVWLKDSKYAGKKFKGGVITNARLTKDAIDYGTCVGLELMSWDYPFNNSLRNQLDQFGLYPITSLQNLTKAEKRSLIEHQIVTVKQLSTQMKILETFKLTTSKMNRVLKEIESFF